MADYGEIAAGQPVPENLGAKVYGRDVLDQNLNYESVASPVLENSRSSSQMRIPQMPDSLPSPHSQTRMSEALRSPHSQTRMPQMPESLPSPHSQTRMSESLRSPHSQTRMPQMSESLQSPHSQTRMSQMSESLPSPHSPARMSQMSEPLSSPHSQRRIPQMPESMQMQGDPNIGYRSDPTGRAQPQSPHQMGSYSSMAQHSLPDPMMRQAYAMPAAGLPARHVHENFYSSPAAGRQYKMASDIFGTGMDRSWTSGSPTMQRSQQGLGQRSEPSSFKITESADRSSPQPGYQQDFASSMPPGNRRTRESPGNPLTGLGYDRTSTKTAKRYFEGSNANQKLW